MRVLRDDLKSSNPIVRLLAKIARSRIRRTLFEENQEVWARNKKKILASKK